MSHTTQNWMSYLDDSKKLTDLTIPGTHDTCTYTAGGFFQCQSMNLEIQFKNGIRFWDIRLKIKKGKIESYHGHENLHIPFVNILTTSAILLQQFPSECIVMCISHENNNNKVELYEKLWPLIKDLGHWYKQDKIPTLGEVRGSVVFMRRFIAPHSEFPIGINLYDWPKDTTKEWENSAGIKLCVQDKFSGYVSADFDVKFEKRVKPVLNKAKSHEDRLFINMTSGTSDLYPESLAKVTNRLLLDYLNQNGKNRFGIIPMDFPESEPGLISQLIGSNFDPFQEMIFQKPTIFENETDGTWTMARLVFNGIPSDHPDLVFIKPANTSSGKVEIHIASGQSSYKGIALDKKTVFICETGGTWLITNYNQPFIGIPNPFQSPPDLVFIKTANTGSGKVEVHIASGASDYKKMILQTATWFNCEDSGVWTMVNYSNTSNHPDLVYIKTRNTESKKVEVHIASGASNYTTMILHAVTAFDCEEDGVWTMADWEGYGADLVFIKTSNTPSGYVEVHIASAKSQYKERILECKTAFKCETDGTWLMQPFTTKHIQDLIFIKTANTPSNNVEVHVASGKR